MKKCLLIFIFFTACSADYQDKGSGETTRLDEKVPQFDVSLIDDGDHSEEFLFPNGLVFDQGEPTLDAVSDEVVDMYPDSTQDSFQDYSQNRDHGVDAEIPEQGTEYFEDGAEGDAFVLRDFGGDNFSQDAGQEIVDAGVLESDVGQEIVDEEGQGEEPFLNQDREWELGARGTLEVTLVSEPLQIIEELGLVDGDEVILANYRFCATTEEDISISTIELAFMGDLDLEVEFEFGDFVTVAHNVDFGSRVSIFREPGEEMIVTGNSCETVIVKTALPVQSTHVEVYISGVVDMEERKIYNGGSHWNHTHGVRTIFLLGDTYFVRVDSRDPEVFSNVENSWLAHFEIESAGNAQVEVSQLRFHVSTIGDVLPMSYALMYQDNSRGGFQLSYETDVFLDGEGIVVDTVRQDGENEDISFGNKLYVEFSLLFCPQDLQEFQIHLDAVESSGSALLLRNPDNSITESPLFQVIEQADAVPHAKLSYVGNYSANNNQHFIWSASAHEDCVEQYKFNNLCPVLGLRVDGITSDRRFPITFESLSFSINGENIREDIDFHMMMKTDLRGDILDEPIHFSQDNQEQIITLVNSVELQQGADVVWIFIYPEIPVEDRQALLAQEFSIEILEGEVTFLGNPAPLFLEGPVEPGVWPWGVHTLPYSGPRIILGSPEVWLESNSIGRPETVLLGDEEVAEVELLAITYSNERDWVQLCDIVFAHNTEKDTPVFESIEVRFGNETFTLSDWDHERAVFRAPEGFCHTIGNGWVESMIVSGRNPSGSTNPGQPLQLELVEFGMQPKGGWEYVLLEDQDYDVPFVVGYEDGRKVLLGEDGAPRIRGRIVNITE